MALEPAISEALPSTPRQTALAGEVTATGSPSHLRRSTTDRTTTRRCPPRPPPRSPFALRRAGRATERTTVRHWQRLSVRPPPRYRSGTRRGRTSSGKSRCKSRCRCWSRLPGLRQKTNSMLVSRRDSAGLPARRETGAAAQTRARAANRAATQERQRELRSTTHRWIPLPSLRPEVRQSPESGRRRRSSSSSSSSDRLMLPPPQLLSAIQARQQGTAPAHPLCLPDCQWIPATRCSQARMGQTAPLRSGQPTTRRSRGMLRQQSFPLAVAASPNATRSTPGRSRRTPSPPPRSLPSPTGPRAPGTLAKQALGLRISTFPSPVRSRPMLRSLGALPPAKR
mmetsp:Transcript_4104/g.17209  ORF Transcript_4104/g.17209 Transcript_4104/m.17209 type:complete len:340 (-) Transcript_4104:1808-2827(-)